MMTITTPLSPGAVKRGVRSLENTMGDVPVFTWRASVSVPRLVGARAVTTRHDKPRTCTSITLGTHQIAHTVGMYSYTQHLIFINEPQTRNTPALPDVQSYLFSFFFF